MTGLIGLLQKKSQIALPHVAEVDVRQFFSGDGFEFPHQGEVRGRSRAAVRREVAGDVQRRFGREPRDPLGHAEEISARVADFRNDQVRQLHMDTPANPASDAFLHDVQGPSHSGVFCGIERFDVHVGGVDPEREFLPRFGPHHPVRDQYRGDVRVLQERRGRKDVLGLEDGFVVGVRHGRKSLPPHLPYKLGGRNSRQRNASFTPARLRNGMILTEGALPGAPHASQRKDTRARPPVIERFFFYGIHGAGTEAPQAGRREIPSIPAADPAAPGLTIGNDAAAVTKPAPRVIALLAPPFRLDRHDAAGEKYGLSADRATETRQEPQASEPFNGHHPLLDFYYMVHF